MKFSQGWSILLGASLGALFYDVAISLVVPSVRSQYALPAALFISSITGAAGALASSSLALSRERGAALGAGLLSPFLSGAAVAEGVHFSWNVPPSLAGFLFFSLSLASSALGAAGVGYARFPRRQRRHLRRVK